MLLSLITDLLLTFCSLFSPPEPGWMEIFRISESDLSVAEAKDRRVESEQLRYSVKKKSVWKILVLLSYLFSFLFTRKNVHVGIFLVHISGLVSHTW